MFLRNSVGEFLICNPRRYGNRLDELEMDSGPESTSRDLAAGHHRGLGATCKSIERRTA